MSELSPPRFFFRPGRYMTEGTYLFFEVADAIGLLGSFHRRQAECLRDEPIETTAVGSPIIPCVAFDPALWFARFPLGVEPVSKVAVVGVWF